MFTETGHAMRLWGYEGVIKILWTWGRWQIRPKAAQMVASRSPLGSISFHLYFPRANYALWLGEGIGLFQSTLEPICFSLSSLKPEPGKNSLRFYLDIKMDTWAKGALAMSKCSILKQNLLNLIKKTRKGLIIISGLWDWQKFKYPVLWKYI